MAIYNVHGGHNSIVPGAASYLSEVVEDRKIKSGIIALLRAEGHTAYDCTDDVGKTQGANLANIVAKCNKHTAVIDVSVHLNASKKDAGDGKTKGVEVFIYNSSSQAKSAALRVCKELASLGFTNRGVKTSTSLYVLSHTKSPAMLVEVCFVDDKDDYNLYKKVGVNAICKAIVSGILGKTISGTTVPSGATNTTPSPSGGSKTSATSAESKAILAVDGKMGTETTKRAQRVFKTTVDGKISNQLSAYKSICAGILSAEWSSTKKGGSSLVKAIQKWLGVTQDGYIGPSTIKALQKKMGTTVDGKLDNPSQCIKAFQTWLNKQ